MDRFILSRLTWTFDTQAAQGGVLLFTGKAQCAACRVKPQFAEPGWNLHTAEPSWTAMTVTSAWD